MKKKIIFSVIFAVALTLVVGIPSVYGQKKQQKVVIKLASMVPANTDWGRMVTKLSAEWKKATNDEVQLLVFADGTQGTEEEVLRKVNMNTLQAAILTSFGLSKIAPEILTLSCPFMFRDDAELDEVLKTVKSDFEAKINSKNYYALTLVKGGWVKFFSRSPVILPSDLKKQKVGSSPSEPELARAFRAMGYQVVEVDNTRVLLALNGGSIDAIYMSPIFAAGAQYFGVAKNMASINVAPFMGGIVLNKHAWESIPAQHRNALIAVTKNISVEMETSLLKLETDTVRLMKNNGLKENQVSARQMEEWYSDMTKAVPGLLGTTFDRATYNKIDGIVKAYRSKK
jgi:TRAP-type C4-dicarboxylate transport system substrate-binding protein